MIQARVRHRSDDNLFTQTVQKGVDERCLSRPHITGEQKESHVAQDSVFERGKGLLVFFTKPQKLRVRAYLKWFYF